MVRILKNTILSVMLATFLLTITLPERDEPLAENPSAEFVAKAPVGLRPPSFQVDETRPPASPPLTLARTQSAEMTAEETEIEDAYQYSEDEKKLIARVVYAESRGERWEGRVAVAQVVINRFESGKFGNSVRRVVFAKNQFAVSSKYNDESMQAVEAVIEEKEHPENMFYFQVSRRKKWRNFVYYDRIGNHNFFCAKG